MDRTAAFQAYQAVFFNALSSWYGYMGEGSQAISTLHNRKHEVEKGKAADLHKANDVDGQQRVVAKSGIVSPTCDQNPKF